MTDSSSDESYAANSLQWRKKTRLSRSFQGAYSGSGPKKEEHNNDSILSKKSALSPGENISSGDSNESVTHTGKGLKDLWIKKKEEKESDTVSVHSDIETESDDDGEIVQVDDNSDTDDEEEVYFSKLLFKRESIGQPRIKTQYYYSNSIAKSTKDPTVGSDYKSQQLSSVISQSCPRHNYSLPLKCGLQQQMSITSNEYAQQCSTMGFESFSQQQSNTSLQPQPGHHVSESSETRPQQEASAFMFEDLLLGVPLPIMDITDDEAERSIHLTLRLNGNPPIPEDRLSMIIDRLGDEFLASDTDDESETGSFSDISGSFNVQYCLENTHSNHLSALSDKINNEEFNTKEQESTSKLEQETQYCPICQEDFTHQQVGRPESCQHYYCAGCIEKWALRCPTCPIDRKVFKSLYVLSSIRGGFVRKMRVKPLYPSVLKFASGSHVMRRMLPAHQIELDSSSEEDGVENLYMNVGGGNYAPHLN